MDASLEVLSMIVFLQGPGVPALLWRQEDVVCLGGQQEQECTMMRGRDQGEVSGCFCSCGMLVCMDRSFVHCLL